MLLFKPEHVQPIRDRRKTQTRRLWPKGCRVKVGSIHQAQTRLLDNASVFARLRVKRVWREDVAHISEADARAEGYEDPVAYLNAFIRINRLRSPLDVYGLMVWCVEFDVVGEEA